MNASQKIHALNIEDNDLEARILNYLFEEFGAVTFAARTLKQACKVIDANRIDLITIDIELGSKQTGLDIVYELYLRYCKQHFKPRLVVLTSMTLSEEDRHDLIESGVSRIIQKPLDPAMAEEILSELQPERDLQV